MFAVYTTGINIGVLSLISSKNTCSARFAARGTKPPSVALRMRLMPLGVASLSREVGSRTDISPDRYTLIASQQNY